MPIQFHAPSIRSALPGFAELLGRALTLAYAGNFGNVGGGDRHFAALYSREKFRSTSLHDGAPR